MYIQSNFAGKTDSLVIVLPNQRSGHFLKKYLAETFPDAVWSPEIYDFRNWIFKQINWRLNDSVDLLFKLFACYKKIEPNASGFEEFYPWGEIVLNDFDEMDKQLINPVQLFGNIIDYQQIQSDFSFLSEKQIQSIRHFFDNFNAGNDDSIKQKSHQIWQILPELYQAFKVDLLQNEVCYEGMAYRYLAENEDFVPESGFNYLFVGFNALYESERKLFKRFQSAGDSFFFFDYDDLYLNDELHEAGYFQRINKKEFPMPKDFISMADELNLFSNLGQSDKGFTSYTLSTDNGQASLLAEILEAGIETRNGSSDELAIVLPDEAILPGILSNFPSALSEINISLGYPMKATQAVRLSELIYQLHRTKSEDTAKKTAWHRNTLMELLRHDYLRSANYTEIEELMLKLSKSARAYHRIPDSSGLLSLLTQPVSSGEEFIKRLDEIYSFLIEEDSTDLPEREKEFIYQYLLSVRQFYLQLTDFSEPLSIELTFRILNRILRKQKIAFKGEPLKGIQIIGPLETRLLDFSHLIILSMNEGTFPPQSFTPSFIPYSIKQGFGMHTREVKDAIYSYYFYRMLQRCRRADFLIPSSSSGGNRSEPSRYIHQLNFSKHFKLIQLAAGNKLSITDKHRISVPKQELNLHEIKWLSPTSLNYYLDCPLKFYFRFVLKINTTDEKVETIGMPEFGNIIHYFMQQIYLQGGMVHRPTLENLLKNDQEIKDRLMQAYDHFGFAEEGLILLAENRLIFENLVTYIKALLRADLQYAPFEIIGTESETRLTLSTQLGVVEIKGTIDRIDRKNGVVRIIDYKTGKDDHVADSIEGLFDRNNPNRKKAIFQILLYSIAYKCASPIQSEIQAYIFNLKKVFNDNFDGLIRTKKDKIEINEVESEFTLKIQELVDEIMDRNIPFQQTDQVKHCSNCDFNLICKR